MKIYVNKSDKNIKSFLIPFSIFSIIGIFTSIFPISSGCKLFRILPSGLIKALIPLFADLMVYTPDSIDLKIDLAKCWCGPVLAPNHASSDIFIIKLKSLYLSTKLGKIIS